MRALRKKRAGISELVATLLTIAITIISGAAVFSYVNSQAGVTEKLYGQSVGTVVNLMQEKFVVFDLSYPAANQISIYIFNTGQAGLQPFSVRVHNPTNTFNVMYNYTTSGGTKTDYVYDLKGTSACKVAASSKESPLLSTLTVPMTVTNVVTLTIPPTQSGCPSYGSTPFQTGSVYSVTVLGLYGNSVTASQVK